MVKRGDKEGGAHAGPDRRLREGHVNGSHLRPYQAHEEAEGAQENDRAQEILDRERGNRGDHRKEEEKEIE